MSRQRIEHRATTTADPSTVYALLRNGATWPTWAPIDSFELKKPGADEREGIGAVRLLRGGRVTGHDEIVELVPHRRFAYRHTSNLPVRDYRAQPRSDSGHVGGGESDCRDHPRDPPKLKPFDRRSSSQSGAGTLQPDGASWLEWRPAERMVLCETDLASGCRLNGADTVAVWGGCRVLDDGLSPATDRRRVSRRSLLRATGSARWGWRSPLARAFRGRAGRDAGRSARRRRLGRSGRSPARPAAAARRRHVSRPRPSSTPPATPAPARPGSPSASRRRTRPPASPGRARTACPSRCARAVTPTPGSPTPTVW